jgi:hypothetical protein
MISLKKKNAKVMTVLCPGFEIIGPDSGVKDVSEAKLSLVIWDDKQVSNSENANVPIAG